MTSLLYRKSCTGDLAGPDPSVSIPRRNKQARHSPDKKQFSSLPPLDVLNFPSIQTTLSWRQHKNHPAASWLICSPVTALFCTQHYRTASHHVSGQVCGVPPPRPGTVFISLTAPRGKQLLLTVRVNLLIHLVLKGEQRSRRQEEKAKEKEGQHNVPPCFQHQNKSPHQTLPVCSVLPGQISARNRWQKAQTQTRLRVSKPEQLSALKTAFLQPSACG